MKFKQILLPLIYVISTLTLTSCTTHPQPRLKYLPDNAIILAFGDSLTYGTGASRDQSYPAVLEKLINRTVINKGIPGLEAANAINILSKEINQYHHPALVILCIGGNDMLKRKKLAKVAISIEKLIKIVQEKQIDLLLISVPRPGFGLKIPDFYKKLAKKYGIVLDNTSLAKLEGDRKYKSDWIHLNAEGYNKLANNIAKLLKQSGAI